MKAYNIVNQSVNNIYENGKNEVVGVVLAKAGVNNYITWSYTHFNITDKLTFAENFDSDKMNCYHGHYINNFKDASADYNRRINRLLT